MMKNTLGICLPILIAGTILAGCGSNEKPANVPAPAVKRQVLTEPFRYHKLIEVSPGQDYDIVSWGRGSFGKGAFAILHSDSAAAKFTTTTGDLDGAIVDVYNSDMDLDGNPEILIEAKGKDTINYTTIYAFEFTYGRAQKLDFPKLTGTFKQGYRGEDNFYIREGKLVREFPIYSGSGKTAQKSGEKRQLEYGLRNNIFTVKQLSKETVSAVKNQPVVKPSPKPEGKKKKATIEKKKKKHTTEKKHKKKHRKRYSDENTV